MMQGHTAAVSQQIDNMSHIFSCTVAAIPAQATITIRLSQVSELIPDVNEKVLIRMPLILHPKYGPLDEYFTSHKIFEEHSTTVLHPDPMLVTFNAYIHGALVIASVKECHNRLSVQYQNKARTEAKVHFYLKKQVFIGVQFAEMLLIFY